MGDGSFPFLKIVAEKEIYDSITDAVQATYFEFDMHSAYQVFLFPVVFFSQPVQTFVLDMHGTHRNYTCLCD